MKKSLSVKKKNHKKIQDNLKIKKIFEVYKKFEFFLKKEIKNKPFAVAVSGGPDSMSLAFLSKCASLKLKLKVKFFIIDHKLRKNSYDEAKKVKLVLKKFKINSNIIIWKGKKPNSNIQSIARKERYFLLNKACKKYNINNLLIGHHRDDKDENFFIRLTRGSGLKGLVSFNKNTYNNSLNLKILRPLINLEKKDLIFISKKVFSFYIEDPSNNNENFQRIRIRKFMKNLEKEGFDKNKLKKTIDNLESSDQAIRYYVDQNIKKNSIYLKNTNKSILNLNFFNQPLDISFRSLSETLLSISGRYYSPRGKSVLSIISKIKSNNFQKTTLGRCYIEKVNKTILISKEN